ncbi:MAG: carboxypeptidase-like regulatory domain-containing protein, partial [Bacteroidota bacterium]
MKKQKQRIQLHIPKPCDEKEANMTPVHSGKFCHQCEQHVMDFTTWTDAQLFAFFRQQNARVCGTFRPDQLDKDLYAPASASKLQRWKVAAALSAGLMVSQPLSAQHQPPSVDLAIENSIAPAQCGVLPTSSTDQLFQAHVLDAHTEEPLIGAHIFIENTQIATVTDLDGVFALPIPAEMDRPVLIVSYVGYEKVYVQSLDFSGVQKIEMKAGVSLPKVEVTAYQTTVKGGLVGGVSTLTAITASESQSWEDTDWGALQAPVTSVYPNPFYTHFSVRLNIKKAAPYLINLYDISGQLKYAATFDLAKGDQDLPLEQLPSTLAAGTYIVQVIEGNEIVMTEK